MCVVACVNVCNVYIVMERNLKHIHSANKPGREGMAIDLAPIERVVGAENESQRKEENGG